MGVFLLFVVNWQARRCLPHARGGVSKSCAVWELTCKSSPLRRRCRNPAELLGLERPVLRFSTVSRRQATLTVNIPVRCRVEPLHLLIDSTDLRIGGKGEWKVKKHGAGYRRRA